MGSNTQVKPFITSSGIGNRSIVGPPFGLVDIGESAEAYLFRVSLPGIRKNECKVRCDVEVDGTVTLRGEVVPHVWKDGPISCETRVQQLASPGPFTISFKLPGPVDPRLFGPEYRADGVFEGIVVKPKEPMVNSDAGVKHNRVRSAKVDAGNPPPPPPPAAAV
ncbi:HSP20-like chaperones superfamily protein [Euphorbia peplus]|nr:HSP20-like chaperones superfamily protein [Euphorbia peplus]